MKSTNRTIPYGIKSIAIETFRGIQQETIVDLTPNLILSSPIFGFSEVFPITHKEDDRIRTEATYQEKEFSDQVAERLKQYKDSAKEQELLKLFKA